MRPLCCPEVSLAAPAPHRAAASGFPAPAPCVQQNNIMFCFLFFLTAEGLLVLQEMWRKHAIVKAPLNGQRDKKSYPTRQYSRHTVPNPQAHAVSHSVAQGDQRQFSNWPNNRFPHFTVV